MNIDKYDCVTDGIYLREHRLMQGHTQDSLACSAGVSRQTVNKIERGCRPKRETLLAIAKALQVSVNALLRNPWGA
jgi:DNA-binding XRE family transcriptional regulator